MDGETSGVEGVGGGGGGMSAKMELVKLHKGLADFLEFEKMPTEQIEIYIWDALDAVEVALEEWSIDWSQKWQDWEQSRPMRREIRRADRVSSDSR